MPALRNLDTGALVEYPSSPYIEDREGSLYLSGRRVFLDCMVIHYREGRSATEIRESFPVLE